jgi:hypothetical protein
MKRKHDLQVLLLLGILLSLIGSGGVYIAVLDAPGDARCGLHVIGGKLMHGCTTSLGLWLTVLATGIALPGYWIWSRFKGEPPDWP